MLQRITKKSSKGFTLVEIMIVVAIIALLAAIAVPGFLRARKRAQATKIINDLRLLDAAVEQYAIEANRAGGSVVTAAQVKLYLKANTPLYNTMADVFGESYGAAFTVDVLPTVPATSFNSLLDVAGTEFFSPYQSSAN